MSEGLFKQKKKAMIENMKITKGKISLPKVKVVDQPL